MDPVRAEAPDVHLPAGRLKGWSQVLHPSSRRPPQGLVLVSLQALRPQLVRPWVPDPLPVPVWWVQHPMPRCPQPLFRWLPQELVLISLQTLRPQLVRPWDPEPDPLPIPVRRVRHPVPRCPRLQLLRPPGLRRLQPMEGRLLVPQRRRLL